MKRSVVVAVAMSGWASCVQAEPLSYDYAYLSRQQTHVNGEAFRNDAVGAYYEIGSHLHVFGSFGNAGSYGNPAWKDSRALRAGAGGHWLLDDDTMIAVEGAVIRAQFDKPPVGTVRDTGGSAIVEVRHRFAPWMEAIASASRTNVLGRRTGELVTGPVFHLSRRLALGAFYRRAAGHAGFEATVRTYY